MLSVYQTRYIFTVLGISFCDLEIEKKKIMEWFCGTCIFEAFRRNTVAYFFFFLEDADIFPYEPKFSILMRLHYFQLGFPS